MQLKIEEKFSSPNKSDVEIYEEEREIKDSIELVKCDLLDIELKMQDALKGAYSTFASQLSKYVADMVEKTSTFLGEDCLGECQDFASKLKNHGMEQFEIQQNWMQNINPDNEEEELDNKE
jgi:hypothetical protein